MIDKSFRILFCPECKELMKQIKNTACLECKCGEIYHVENLAFPNAENNIFKTDNEAREFLERIIRDYNFEKGKK